MRECVWCEGVWCVRECVWCEGVWCVRECITKSRNEVQRNCSMCTSHRLSLVLQPLVASTIVNELVWKRLSVVVWQPGELLAHSKLLAVGMKHPLDNGGKVLGPLCLT